MATVRRRTRSTRAWEPKASAAWLRECDIAAVEMSDLPEKQVAAMTDLGRALGRLETDVHEQLASAMVPLLP